MPLTQQFARVTPEYLERCRASALAASDASPGWDPPDACCLLDTDWAIWGLIRHCSRTGVAPEVIALLDRAVSGDPGGDAAFLDHEEVYDGFGDPPRVLTPTTVTDRRRAGPRPTRRPPLGVADVNRRGGHRLRVQCVVTWVD